MPELPEVEIVRQSLDKNIKYKKIKNVIIRNRNLRFKIPLKFENFLRGQEITKVDRFSKYLILSLSNNSFCLLHLGMSGTIHLVFNNKKNFLTNTSFYNSPILPKKHNHIEIIFSDLKIIYNDPRRFGFIDLLKKKDIHKHFLLNKLGFEALSKELTINNLKPLLKNRTKSIKNTLIDQTVIAGIGNIYASEILYKAKIHPFRSTNSLSDIDLKTIIKACRFILKKAIKLGGTTIKNHAQPDGKLGYFKQKLKVYGRTGEKCFSCKNNIINSSIAKRSTYYCDNCQM